MVPVVYVTWFMFVTFVSLLGELSGTTALQFQQGEDAAPW